MNESKIKEVVRGIVREEFKKSLSEMGVNDVHFKNILRVYDHGGSFTKKKVASAVCKNPNANRNKIIDYLKDMDYNEITQIEDELRIGESVNEAGINKMYVKYLAVQKKVAELVNAQLKMKDEYFGTDDPKKKAALLPAMKKGTEQLKMWRRNLQNIEDKYILNLDKDAEYQGESINEATTSWSRMMSDVKKGGSGPWSLVGIENNRVVAQKNSIKDKNLLPAHFEAMRRENPKAKIHIEDGGGQVVWNEKK